MTTKRLFLTLIAVLALVAPAAAQPAVVVLPDGQGISDYISAVSTDVGVYVKYIGNCTAATSTVEVAAATGDLSFVACGAADTTVNPQATGTGICGNTGGTIDVSDADCNTIGEVVDLINGSPNWIASPGAMLRSDSSDNTLITLAATPAQYGLGLLKDTVVALNITLWPRPDITVDGGLKMLFSGNSLNPNPYRNFATYIYRNRENITSGGTVGQFATSCVKQEFKPKQTAVANATPAVSYAETARTVWTQTGAATTVEQIQAFGDLPLVCNAGERPIVRISATTNLTAPGVASVGVMRVVRAQQ